MKRRPRWSSLSRARRDWLENLAFVRSKISLLWLAVGVEEGFGLSAARGTGRVCEASIFSDIVGYRDKIMNDSSTRYYINNVHKVMRNNIPRWQETRFSITLQLTRPMYSEEKNAFYKSILSPDFLPLELLWVTLPFAWSLSIFPDAAYYFQHKDTAKCMQNKNIVHSLSLAQHCKKN